MRDRDILWLNIALSVLGMLGATGIIYNFFRDRKRLQQDWWQRGFSASRVYYFGNLEPPPPYEVRAEDVVLPRNPEVVLTGAPVEPSAADGVDDGDGPEPVA